jgi:hypothetical protein
MRLLIVTAMAVLCLTSMSALSFADEMGKGKEHMKGEIKGEKGKTHDMGEMKSDKGRMQGGMKGEMGKDDIGKMRGDK